MLPLIVCMVFGGCLSFWRNVGIFARRADSLGSNHFSTCDPAHSAAPPHAPAKPPGLAGSFFGDPKARLFKPTYGELELEQARLRTWLLATGVIAVVGWACLLLVIFTT